MMTFSFLSGICNLKNLYDHVVPSVADKWRDIGVHLLPPTLVENRVLEVIAADHPHSIEDCCKAMFDKWLEIQKDTSWNQLIEALNAIELYSFASKLRKDIIGRLTKLHNFIYQ